MFEAVRVCSGVVVMCRGGGMSGVWWCVGEGPFSERGTQNGGINSS